MNSKKQLPDEDEKLEYKACFNKLSNDVWETVSAFENTSGGKIVLGVDEVNNSGNISYVAKGIKNPHKIVEQFCSNIANKISSSTITNGSMTLQDAGDGRQIIVINVPEARDNKKPVMADGKPYVRKGSVDVEAKGEDLVALITNASDDLDTEILKNYDLNDLNLTDVAEYQKMISSRDKYRFYDGMELETFLEQIGVISKDYFGDGEKGITVGGLLFFGKNNAIVHKFPGFQLEYIDQSSVTDRWKERISTVIDDLNIFSFFRETLSVLNTTIEDRFALNADMSRTDTSGTMAVALREALVNMLMHANYFENQPLAVHNKMNFYEFINPGKMKIPVEAFFTSNMTATRNPVISKLFVQLGFGERAGTGGETIFHSSVVNHCRAPEITTNEQETKLVIWKVDYADSFSGEEINERGRMVLKVVMSSPKRFLSKREIEEKTGLTRSQATEVLKDLMGKQIITKQGNSRSTKYGVKATATQLIAQVESKAAALRSMFKSGKFD